MLNGPQRVRSAGIWVRLIQAPLTYRKKSSPGLTVLSIAVRSTPHAPIAGFAAAADWSASGLDEAARASSAAQAHTGTLRRLKMFDMRSTPSRDPLIRQANRLPLIADLFHDHGGTRKPDLDHHSGFGSR